MSINGETANKSEINSCSKVLNDLESRYTCLHQPLAIASCERPEYLYYDGRRQYLTSLHVYGTKDDVDLPHSSLAASFSKLLADQNIIDPHVIKKKITAALSAISFRGPHVLVQFWSPVTVGKRCLLTTLDQPFGLGAVDEGLYMYRLDSEQRLYVVDGEHREELGPPGRVYHQKLPEWSLDINGLSTRQSVKHWASSYNIHGYLHLPVFEPDRGVCVGVFELITSSNYVDFAFEVQEVSRALKVENLKSPNVLEDHSLYVGNERRQNELNEIFCFLKSICDVQNIPLAQTWALSKYSSVVSISGNLEPSCSSFNKYCLGKVCMSTYALPFYIRDLSMWGFLEACTQRHLDKSQGVVGRSFSSCGLCICGDVTKLGVDEYSLAPYARVNGITSCLAIYLKSTEMDVEYVIELVLPRDNANKADLHSLVKTVKQQIKHVSSVKLGTMSSPQVMGGDPLDWNLESPQLSPITLLSEKVEVIPDIGNQQPLLESIEQNSVEDVAFSNNQRIRDPHNWNLECPPSPITLLAEQDVLPDTGNQQSLLKSSEQNDVAFSKNLSEFDYVEHMDDENLENEPLDPAAAGTSQSVVPCLEVGVKDSDINKGKTRREYKYNSNKRGRKRKMSDRSYTLEEISKHYGKTMDEAANILRVSRSTLKRICRSLGVLRWPYKNVPNKSDSFLKSDQTEIVIHASQGALVPVLEGSNVPLSGINITCNPATLTEHGKHGSTLTLCQQVQSSLPDEHAQPETTIRKSVEILTIKATYKKNTVKFPFVLSDGFGKLEEMIATRLQLSVGSFSLKYEDKDGDMILIACDSGLMGAVDDFTQPDHQTVIRLLVWPLAHQSPGA